MSQISVSVCGHLFLRVRVQSISFFCLRLTERPLHPKEKVLEQALQWCKMADPSSAYLVVKKVPIGEGINILTCMFTCCMNTAAVLLTFSPSPLW